MFLRSKFQEFTLKNRSSTMTSKQGLMCDPPSTSILETMAFSSIRNSSRKVFMEYEEETRGIGLGLLDILTNEDSVTAVSKQEKRVVVFGSKLKIQIPSPATESISISSVGRVESRHSPIEFGIKTRNSLVALYPSSPAQRTLIPRSEMAQSEDYTRVILHGPNPKTTHIFEDCIIESGSSESADHENWNCSCGDGFNSPVNDLDLSSFSNGCRKRTNTGEEIFVGRS